MKCTACDEGRCDERFVCCFCGFERSRCEWLVGGLDGFDGILICKHCYEELTLPPEVLALIRRRYDRPEKADKGGV